MTLSDWVSYGLMSRVFTAKWVGQLWLNELLVSFSFWYVPKHSSSWEFPF